MIACKLFISIILFVSPWIYEVVEPVVIIWFVKFDVIFGDDDEDGDGADEKDGDDYSDEKDGIWNAEQ